MSNLQIIEKYAPTGIDADSPRWFVAISGAQQGPLNLRQVMQKALLGEVDLYDQFWKPGMTSWLDGWSVDEIRGSIAFLYAETKRPLGIRPAWFVTDALLQSHGVDASSVSESQIYSLLIEKKLSPVAQVWRQGYAAWKPLTLVSELAHVVLAANTHLASVARANLEPPPLSLPAALPLMTPPLLPTSSSQTGAHQDGVTVFVSGKSSSSHVSGDFGQQNLGVSHPRPPFPVLIDEERVMPVREFFALLRSHPLAVRGDARRLQVLEDMMIVDFMTGNAYALESKLSALQKMVKGLH